MAIHHIQNPEEVIKEIKKVLIPGGYIYMREHLPTCEKDKMYLDCCEKCWACAFTTESEYDEFTSKIHPLEAYFTFKELCDLIGSKPIA